MERIVPEWLLSALIKCAYYHEENDLLDEAEQELGTPLFQSLLDR